MIELERRNLIRIFIASPGDVAAERRIIREIVQEISELWGNTFGFSLECTGWENKVHPDVGLYAQDVINKQISSDFEIIVALFWERVGTPTPKALSGTVEEIERAIARRSIGAGLPIVMVYFKTPRAEFVDPSEVIALKSLREKFGEVSGLLYGKFDNEEEFSSIFRMNLSLAIQACLERDPKEINYLDKQNPDNELLITQFHTLLEKADEAFELSSVEAEACSLSMEIFTTRLVEEKARFDNANQSAKSWEIKSILEQGFERFAAYQQDLAREINLRTPALEASYSKALNLLSRAFALMIGIGASVEDIDEQLCQVESLSSSITSGREAIKMLRSILDGVGVLLGSGRSTNEPGLPNVLALLNPTNRKNFESSLAALSASLDDLTSTLSHISEGGNQLIKSVQELVLEK